ncbi:methyltransferase-like protein 17 [Elysia marginata]|uniref:Methyltransferase-like protein 17 n=1 Tax=Elysia marginata TaxID=1093978 RepID=A0AAV4J2I5_9GAST|nr:methyltransferase-like protein 17 [Elysia marginata]
MVGNYTSDRWITSQTCGLNLCQGNIISKDTCVDENVREDLEKNHVGVSGHINYRKHPGIMRRSHSSLPTRLVKAIKVLLERYPVTSLVTKTDKLVRYLNQRQPPLDNAELSQRVKNIEDTIFAEGYPVTSLVTKTDKLVRYLNQRQPPLDNAELSQRVKNIEDTIFAEGICDNLYIPFVTKR